MEEAQSHHLNPLSSEGKDDQFNFLYGGKKGMMSKEEIEKFWKGGFVMSLQQVSPNFVIDERNRNLIGAIYTWIWSNLGRFPPGVLDPHKGLLLWGEIGTGKTTLLKGIQRYLATINQIAYGFRASNICIEIRSAAEIALRYSIDGINALDYWTDRNMAGNLAIDEIGREELSKHFGTSCNVVQTVLQLRYEQRHNILTLGSTNMDMAYPDEFRERYGDYIMDRAKEMFNFVKVGGGSRRR